MTLDPIAIVDIGVGNIGSVCNMIRRAEGQAVVVSDPAALSDFSKIILPGVGSFDAAVQRLDAAGMRPALHHAVTEGKQLLGICLGMQLLADGSEEGSLPGLGLIPGRVKRFQLDSKTSLKVPHMGWNRVTAKKPHGLVEGIDDQSRFYFVHSYYYSCTDPGDTLLESTYGTTFASGVQRGRVAGVQFHPEKSHRHGLGLLRNFVRL